MVIETDIDVIDKSAVYVNDFDDNYHRLDDEPKTDLERQARKIRRRYRSFDDYRYAMEIYNEYMSMLALKYGGKKYFDFRLNAGTVYEYIPPLPKLKNTAMNKFIMSTGVMISDTKRLKVAEELLDEYESEFDEEILEDTYVSGDIIENKNKLVAKDLDDAIKSSKVSLKHMKETDVIDLLSAYFDDGSTKKGKKKKKRDKVYSVTDIIEDKDLEDENDDEAVFYRGRMLKASEVKELKIYTELGKYGWNSLALMKNNKKHSPSNAIESVLKEERKKNKHKKKKSKKKSKADEFLIKVMGDNDYEDFSEYEDEMLDFTINNVFK